MTDRAAPYFLSAVLLLTLPFWLWSVLHWLPARQDSTYPESSNVAGAQRLATGRPLYPDYRTRPHVANLYGPVSYLLPGLACKLSGGGERAARLTGRAQSLLCLLAAAAVVVVLARRRGADRWSLALAAGLLLFSPLLYGWMTSARPDFLAAFLSLAGVALLCGDAPRPAGRLVLAGLCFLLAAFTKQTQLVGAAAACLWLLARPASRRDGLLLAAGLGLAGLAGLAALHLATGELSTLNMVIANSGQWDWYWGRKVVGQSLAAGAALFVPAGLVCLRAILRRSFGLPHLYFLLSLAAAVALAMKCGSSRNYFFEAAMAAAILVPEALDWLREESASRRLHAAGLAALFCLPALVYLAKPVCWAAGRDPAGVPVGWRGGQVVWLDAGRIRFPNYPETLRRAREAAGPVLVTDEYSELSSGKPPVCLDWFAHGVRVERGLASGDDIRRDVAARRYALIACEPCQVGSLFGSRNFLLAHYRPDGEEATDYRTFLFFVPRLTDPPLTVDSPPAEGKATDRP